MLLFFKTFALSSKKTVEVYVSQKTSDSNILHIRFVQNVKGRKSVSVSVNDMQTILNESNNILRYLDGSEKEVNILLSKTSNGETRLSCETYRDSQYVHIRYMYRNSENELVPTSFGVSLTVSEFIQLFKDLDKIISYIKYITPYIDNSYKLFRFVAEHVSDICLAEYNSESCSIDVFLTNRYKKLFVKVDVHQLATTYCKQYKLKQSSIKDIEELISYFILNECTNFNTFIKKKYSSSMLKTLLSSPLLPASVSAIAHPESHSLSSSSSSSINKAKEIDEDLTNETID